MTLSEEIQKMIMSALESMEVTSANPTHINRLIQVNHIDAPDLDIYLARNDKDKFNDEVLQKEKSPIKTTENPFDNERDTLSMENEIRGFIPTRDKKDTIENPFKNDKNKTELEKGFLQKITKDDAKGILGKAGIKPENLSNIIASTRGGGIGGLGGITRLAGLAAPVAGPLAIALMIEPMTKAIIKELQRPGGFLDKRVKIDAQKEAFAELDRQTRQNTRIGNRQVVIQQFEGFRNFEGYGSTNTSRMIRENADRVLDVGLFDRAEGL